MGIPKADAFVSTIVEIALSLVSGVLVFLVFLPFMGPSGWAFVPAAAALVAFLFIIIEPRIFLSLLNPVLGKMGMQKISKSLGRKRVAFLLAYLTAIWSVFGFGFFIFLNAFYDISLWDAGVMTGIFTFSFVAGFVVLITPGGLGVREGVMSLLLSAYMPLPLAIAVSLFSRLWFMAAEVLAIAIASTGHHINQKRA